MAQRMAAAGDRRPARAVRSRPPSPPRTRTATDSDRTHPARTARTAPHAINMPHAEDKSWIARWWRALLTEVVATALLMILGVGSMLPTPTDGSDHSLTHPALAFGFVVTALVQAFGATSGAHMNPAVTLAALVHKQIQPALAAGYFVAQTLGALVGFGLLLSLGSARGACAGVTAPARGVGAGGAALVEGWLTAALVLAVCGLWRAHDPARPDHAAPLKIGLTVAGLVYAGGKLTGASLNPARSLAPALLLGCWDAHWAYWLGPLGGALLAALLQRHVLAPPAPPAPRPEALPLSDKLEP